MVQLATNVRTILMFMSIHAQQDILVHVLLDMDIHLQQVDVVHVEQYLELAINAIRPIFIAIHVQRGSCHLCLVLTDTHIQLRRYVLVVLHRDFAINATYRLLLPVQALAFLHILDLVALLQAVLVHHLHQVLEVIQITISPVLQDFLTHVIMDIQTQHMRCAPADLKD